MSRKSNLLLILGLLVFACTKDKESREGANNKVTLGPTAQVTSITINSAVSGGNVLSVGIDEVIERGVCWNTSTKPTIDNPSSKKTVNGKGIGAFSSNLTSLSEGTTYWVRSYARTEFETIYGSELTFTTIRCPIIATTASSNIQGTSATASANLSSTGGQTILERGFCFHTSTAPTVNNSKVIVPGIATGVYSAPLTNLTPNTTYYLRSYVSTANCNITYGNEVTFKTPPTPILTTKTITSIGVNSATSGGDIASSGGGTIIQKGICWSTNPNPTIDPGGYDGISNDAGGTSYTSILSNLLPNTRYYVRAYAKNDLGGIGYGSNGTNGNLEFTTLGLPIVITVSASSITATSALSGGDVTSDGGSPVTARGICWSTNPGVNLTNTPFKTTNGQGIGAFVSQMTNLTINTRYYYRAYATNSLGNTAYGAEATFVTLQGVPTVTTSPIDAGSITASSAVGGGQVTSNGGASIVERGICWNLTGNPDPAVDAKLSDGVNALTVFSFNMTGLQFGRTYYVKAYVRNAFNIVALGNQVSFITKNVVPPTVILTGASNISTSSVTISGDVTSDGGGTVSERGVCITPSTGFPNQCTAASTSGTGPFSVTLTGLQPNTQYRYVLYARNQSNPSPASPSYSSSPFFSTLSVTAPVVTTTAASSIATTSAILGGNVTSAGGGTITERGVCWNTTGNPTYLNQSQTATSGTGAYSLPVTGLLPNTTYYFRAYARNQANPSGNPSYGSVMTFQTPNLTAPSLLSPTNGITYRCCGGVNFSWSSVAGATSYEIQVTRSSTFAWSLYASALYDCGGPGNPTLNSVNTREVSGTTYCLRMAASNLNSTWYWRVRALNGTIQGPWSSINNFTFFY